jgi:Haem-binding uptake, Tiki superfamily, ChaN
MKPREYSTYVDYVIRPSYDMHKSLGLLKRTMSGVSLDETMPFRNFFSGRILWDEGMANAAHMYLKSHPNTLMLGLVGADHVKFRHGIPGRFARLGEMECLSVMLNPTLIDSRPSGSVGMEGFELDRTDEITLQLRYLKDDVEYDSPVRGSPESTGGVLAISDYIIAG